MAFNHSKLKTITFSLDATNDFECQIQEWEISNDSDAGDRLYSFCPDGESFEESDDEYSLKITFYSDWTAGGVSEYLQMNDREIVAFELNHFPDVPTKHVKWTGNLRIKAPNVGGKIRDTEMTEAEFMIVGKPVFVRGTP